MDRLKSWLPYVPGAVVGLLQAGLQLSGYTNVLVAIALWGLAAILLILAAWHSIRENGWQFQWPVVRKATNVIAQITSTNKEMSIARDLYVGEISLCLDQLNAGRYIAISIRSFNGTGSVITMSGLKGNISVRDSKGNVSAGSAPKALPSPAIGAASERTIQPSREWKLNLMQPIPPELADQISALLSGNSTVTFDLDALDILAAMADHPEQIERMPLWNGVTIQYGIRQSRQMKYSAGLGTAQFHYECTNLK